MELLESIETDLTPGHRPGWLTVTVDRIIAEGNEVAFQVTYEGTHTGPFGDIPATNKHYRWTDTLFVTIENGKMVEISAGSKCTHVDVFKKLAEE